MKNIKTILLSIILLGVFNAGYSQCLSVINKSKNMYSLRADNSLQVYVGGALDLRKVKEGVDFDLELGVKRQALVAYVFYGNYNKVEYTNYGGGIDYQFLEGYVVDAFIGANAGAISVPTTLTANNVSYFAYALRIKTLSKITERIGITLTGQYQQRPDNPIKDGIFEVNAGVQIKIN